MKGLIEKFKLTEKQVLIIVMEWYTKGMCPDIFQNEDGLDLEEWVENKLHIDSYNIIKWTEDKKMSNILYNNLCRNFMDFNVDQLTWEIYFKERGCGLKTWKEFVKLRGY